MAKIKTITLIVSLSLNALFIALVAAAVTGKASTISFYSLEREGIPSVAAAVVAGAPPGASIAFNAVEISVRRGESASLQFSSTAGRGQANWMVDALYDHRIIAVRTTTHGIVITGLEPGEAVMQSFSGGGFRDVAVITVTE